MTTPATTSQNVPCARHSLPDPEAVGSVRSDANRPMPTRLEQLVRDFLAHLRDRNLAPLSIRRYGEEAWRLVAFVRRECPAALDAPMLVDKALLVLHLRNGHILPRPQAPTTWNARLTALRRFFGFLVHEKTIVTDPSADIAFARVPEKAPSYLTRDDYLSLLRAVETHASEHYRFRDLAIIITLWNTGMRVGELVSLDRERVDFAAERFRGVRLKGGRIDDVHFNVEVAIAVRRWLLSRGGYAHAGEQTALFLSDRGRRLSVKAVEDLFTKYTTLARLGKRVTPHTMRHSAATELVRQGVAMPVVAEALRHRSLNTTKRYVHLVGAEVHAAIALLGNENARRKRRAA